MNSPLSSSIDELLPPRADVPPPSPPPRKRRWSWRFSLRLFLLVQVLLAVCLGYVGARVHSFRGQRRVIEQMPDGERRRVAVQTRPAEPQWFWSRIGTAFDVVPEDVVAVQVHYHALTAAEAQQIGKLPRIESLQLARGLEGADAMRRIAKLPHLKTLELRDAERCALSDDALQGLVGNATITHLLIDSVNVTDDGIAALAAMPNVDYLDIHYARVSIAGLRPWIARNKLRQLRTPTRLTAADCLELSALSSLEHLQIYELTAAGAIHLAALPRLRRISFTGPFYTPSVRQAIHALPAHIETFDDHSRRFRLPRGAL